MSKTVEFLFDFVSPTSYLAYMVLPKIIDRADGPVPVTTARSNSRYAVMPTAPSLPTVATCTLEPSSKIVSNETTAESGK